MARTWQTAGGSIRVNRTGDLYTVRIAFNAAYDLRQKWNLNYNAGVTGVAPVPANISQQDLVACETAEGSFVDAAASVSPHSDVGDDSAPLNYSATYIGGNHGANMVANVTVASHDKTAADVGSLWTDDAAKSWCLIKIVDATHLWFLASFTTTNDNFVPAATSVTVKLTHASGATHTTVVTVGSQAVTQLLPAVSRCKKICLLDGAAAPGKDGWYPCDAVDIVEEYDILDPAAIRAYMVANVGSIPAPDWSRDVAAVAAGTRVSNHYHIARNGAVTIDGRCAAIKQLNVAVFGGTQMSVLNAPAGGHRYLFMPGVADFTLNTHPYTFGTGTGQLYDTLADACIMTSARWSDAAQPPLRAVEYRVTAAGAKEYTWAVGIDPTVGYGIPATRASQVPSGALDLISTGTQKVYPKLFYNGGNIAAGTEFSFRCHRCPDDPTDLPSQCIARSLYQIDALTWRLVLDFSAAYTGAITLPSYLAGMVASVTSGTGTVDSRAGATSINVSVAGAMGLIVTFSGTTDVAATEAAQLATDKAAVVANAANIKKGVEVLGTTGAFNPSARGSVGIAL